MQRCMRQKSCAWAVGYSNKLRHKLGPQRETESGTTAARRKKDGTAEPLPRHPRNPQHLQATPPRRQSRARRARPWAHPLRRRPPPAQVRGPRVRAPALHPRRPPAAPQRLAPAQTLQALRRARAAPHRSPPPPPRRDMREGARPRQARRARAWDSTGSAQHSTAEHSAAWPPIRHAGRRTDLGSAQRKSAGRGHSAAA
jgi:hypothetical protein